MGVATMSFKLINFKDDEKRKGFPKKYIPNIIETESGFFIQPVEKIIDIAIRGYVKFLVLDKNFTPIHGHDYQFVRLPDEGYLMRIVLTYKDDRNLSEDFTVDYIININDIEVVSFIEKSTNNKEILDGGITETKYFEHCRDLEADVLSNLLADRNEFFRLYLRDIV